MLINDSLAKPNCLYNRMQVRFMFEVTDASVKAFEAMFRAFEATFKGTEHKNQQRAISFVSIR